MQKPPKRLLWLIYVTTLLRLVLGGTVELGNDEVYYHTYASYPAFSHFDHPPMVGIVIWLFSFGGYLKHHLFMRLGAIILAIANTFIIWQIGYKLKDKTTAWYAALLYNASFYTSLIAGIFIMPDTPQVFFWLLSLWLMVSISKTNGISSTNKIQLLLLGVSIGLAMLSKYTSAYLWLGFLCFLLFHKRAYFARIELYLSGAISLLLFSPVLYWNYRNHFISFTFHQDRVNMAAEPALRWDYLATEIGGAFAYQNPLVFIIIVIAVIGLMLGKTPALKKADNSLLLWLSIPIIVSFLSISLFRRTLPHWTGPGYIALILLAAAHIAKASAQGKKIRAIPAYAAIMLFMGGGIAAVYQVNIGILPIDEWGDDPTLEMYGWSYLGQRFQQISADAAYTETIDNNTPLLSTNWFDAAHFDYYVAPAANTYVMAWGSLERIHKYAWINQSKGGLTANRNFWFISFNGWQDVKVFKPYFNQIEFVEAIPIYRHDKMVKEAHVFLLKQLKYSPNFTWQTINLY